MQGNNPHHLSGHQGEGSSSGGRSVDDETFGYMTNNLNQYTSLSDEYGNTVTRKYDKAGNMIENDEFFFQYDYKNRLVKATRNNPPTPLPGGGQEEYMIVTMNYDVLGRRVEKHIDRKSNEGEKVRYTYSNLDAIQEERTYNIGEGRNLKKELIYGGGIDDIEGYILTRGDEVRTFRYQKNHQNSVTAITDDTGKVVESYRYDAFGNFVKSTLFGCMIL